MAPKLSIIFTSLLAFCTGLIQAAEDEWVSPQYDYFFQYQLPVPPIAVPKATWTNTTTGTPIDFYEVKIKSFQGQPYPNLGKADLVGYDGMSPGPTFKVTRGHETVVRFVNEYDRPSVIHLHGSYSRAPFDGWAEDTIDPGQYKDYYYPNTQSARTMWYHDHAVHITALNAYYGQAGFYIIDDPAENARVQLPSGKYDIPLMLQAKQYQSNGQLLSPENELISLYGDVFHVNGQPWPNLDVEPRKYRFRLLDASISRTFKLSLVESDQSTKIPFTVVASDAGLLAKPVTTDDLYLSMAERYEIIVDFAGFEGKKIIMKNARAVMRDTDYAGTDRVMQFTVGTTVTDTTNNGNPPTDLSALDLPTGNSVATRNFRFGRANGQWTINGVTFADVNNRILARPEPGTVEIWDLENNSGGWSHPIHVHLVDMQIISRTGSGRGSVMPYESAGLKDVILLGTNEKVRVKAVYGPWNGGLYMFHCHNLIHEDHDMMAAFNLSKIADLGYPETTNFDDPMDPRFRAKPYTGTDEAQVTSELLPWFSSLDSYSIKESLELAIENYHQNHTTKVRRGRRRVSGSVKRATL